MPRTQRMIINDESTVYHVMSRTALDGFPLGDVETPVKSAALVFPEELNGVKRFYAGSYPALRCSVFGRNLRILPDGKPLPHFGADVSRAPIYRRGYSKTLC